MAGILSCRQEFAPVMIPTSSLKYSADRTSGPVHFPSWKLIPGGSKIFAGMECWRRSKSVILKNVESLVSNMHLRSCFVRNLVRGKISWREGRRKAYLKTKLFEVLTPHQHRPVFDANFTLGATFFELSWVRMDCRCTRLTQDREKLIFSWPRWREIFWGNKNARLTWVEILRLSHWESLSLEPDLVEEWGTCL